MFVLPKGTLVKVGGIPFRLLADVLTDGLEENYALALSHAATGAAKPNAAHCPRTNSDTRSVSS